MGSKKECGVTVGSKKECGVTVGSKKECGVNVGSKRKICETVDSNKKCGVTVGSRKVGSRNNVNIDLRRVCKNTASMRCDYGHWTSPRCVSAVPCCMQCASCG